MEQSLGWDETNELKETAQNQQVQVQGAGVVG